MGQQSSSPVVESGTQTHERLGVIRVFQTPDFMNQHQDIYRIQLKRPLQSQKGLQKWLSYMRQIDSEQARDVLFLPLSFQYEKTGLCGSSGHVMLTFEHFPYVLKTEIKNRRKMGQYFEQSQLWYLMYNLVQAGAIFQRKGQKLGDIHPSNCLLNQNGQLKIVSLASMPDQSTNYEKIVQSPMSDAYLAPEQIDETFLEKGIYPNIDQNKAQVFSIGMTLLQAVTLQDCFYTYNRGPYKVNKKRLVELQKVMRARYSQDLCGYLDGMLQELPKGRKRAAQIFDQLHPYQQAILQLRPFNVPAETSMEKQVYNYELAHNQTPMVNPLNYNLNTSRQIPGTNANFPLYNASNQTHNFSHMNTWKSIPNPNGLHQSNTSINDWRFQRR